MGGRGDYSAPACDPANTALHKITTPGPLVSLGRPVRASAAVANAARIVDGHYDHSGMSVAATMLPAWVAIELVPGPQQLLLTWADVGWNDYNTPALGNSPAAYTIETSADSTDGTDGAWTVVATVTANPVRERTHRFPFAGKKWVRMSLTAAASTTANPVVAIDELALYDVTASATESVPVTTSVGVAVYPHPNVVRPEISSRRPTPRSTKPSAAVETAW